MSALRVDRIDDPAELEELLPEWELLDQRIRPRTPFTSPRWNVLWWQHLRARGLLAKDELFAHVVRNAEGELLAVAPLTVTRRPSVGPFRVRQLQFFGADINLTEVRGLACTRTDQDEAMAALLDYLVLRPAEWDWLEWPGLADDSAIDVSDPEIRVHNGVPLYYLTLPSSWEDLVTGLARGTREALDECYESPARGAPERVFRVVQAAHEVPEALNTLFRLHRARSLAAGPLISPDVFRTSTAREFFAAYARQMAERGALCLFQVELGGQVVATRVGFVLGEELYLYHSGHDPALGGGSVMTALVAEVIQWAIREGLKVISFSTGRDPAMRRWRPQETVPAMPAPTRQRSISVAARERLAGAIRGASLLTRLREIVRPAR
jgi:CelD/BcsL family acetyltransferase involved in cellulose biosynthesis